MAQSVSTLQPGLSLITSDTPSTTPRPTVLLGHAMFNTPWYFSKPQGSALIDYLVNQGFDVAIIDLPQMSADTPPKNVTFSSYVDKYVTAINALKQRGAAPSSFIGHSVGGVIGLAALSAIGHSPESVVLLAPALWGFVKESNLQSQILRWSQTARIAAAVGIAKVAGGYLPSKALSLGNAPQPIGYLKELLAWNTSRSIAISPSDGLQVDISDWSKLKSKVLVLSAPKDTSMAPPQSLQWIVELLPASTQSEIVSTESNYGFDADHFSLIYGAKAAQSVWPRICSFVATQKEAQ